MIVILEITGQLIEGRCQLSCELEGKIANKSEISSRIGYKTNLAGASQVPSHLAIHSTVSPL